MPIRADLRHLYNTPEWRERRRQILEVRAKNRCETCDREHGQPYLNRRNKWVTVQLGCAHLDQNAENNSDDNLKALCRACHLAHDRAFHLVHAHETRATRKDAARPLLASEASL